MGVALAGGFGRIAERYLRDATEALDYFSKLDAQAAQYSMITKSLLATCLDHIQRRELDERLARVKASSDLFGLQVGTYQQFPQADDSFNTSESVAEGDSADAQASVLQPGFATPDWEEFDLGAFGDFTNNANQDMFGTLNLFPMFDNL